MHMISPVVPSTQPGLIPATQSESLDVEMQDGDTLALGTLEGETSDVSGF